MTDLASLVAAAGAGDQHAWDALVRRFDPMLRRIARNFRLPPHQADDAVQATWMRLLRHLHRLDEPAGVGRWLVTTARRESLRVLQRAARELPAAEPVNRDVPDPVSRGALDALIERERAAAVRAAMNRLTPRQRALIDMFITHPAATYDEISAALAMPVGSIGPTRGRAVARLRDLLRCSPYFE